MARQIADVTRRDGWKSDKSVVPDMQRLLVRLTTLKVDRDLLQSTKIGAAVNKLKKHDDEVVRGYSASLTKKWMTEVGVAAKSSSASSGARRAPSASPPKPDSGNQKRLESARKRLQEGYASERAKRDSRTVQVLSGPIAKGRRGTTVSTAPSRSSIGRAQLAQRRPLASANHRAASAPPVARRVLPTSRLQPQARRPVTSLANMYVSSSSTQANGRARPGSRPSSASSSRGGSVPRDLPPAVDARKAMLDKMYPRVCGVGTASTSTGKTAGEAKKRTNAAARRKEMNYSESQREVVSWLQGLSVDMSEYAPAFFENGFDSVKLLSTIEKADLPSLVPKKGHHRLIQQALDDLRHKHSTSAASERRDRFPKESRMRRRDPFEDEDSDDSFVVSDDGEYRPGHIAAMFRKNRKRRYSIDSEDSINMEATFDEIQKEEKRRSIPQCTKPYNCHTHPPPNANIRSIITVENLLFVFLPIYPIEAPKKKMLKLRSALGSLRRSGGKTLQLLALPSSRNARPRPVNVPTKSERRAALALSAVALSALAAGYSTSASSESKQQARDFVVSEPHYLSTAEEFLYPALQPFNTGMLRVSPVHELYYEECGNPYGKPVVLVHGGPGAGCSADMRRFHDPRVYRIILLDQRGAGRSKPHASLEDNTTWHLVEDMEKLRRHLGVEQWQVFGGSWGSTLLVLRGIFHLRKQEIDFYYQHGSNFLYPDQWEAYRDAIPEDERGDFVKAYHKRLTSDDPKVRIPAALAWTTWEKTTSNLIPPVSGDRLRRWPSSTGV
ncbi:unnamed protein product [Phytophthora fragariaefolia]|uniref:prolyl aminopeptidase n=1 Tax=Phytophthora fragariaefolia TaxID=1490495 RepID=A0A9W6XHQ4_9STRA|nr:unnamed protein product [Phytophthora fragariaefolia]